MKTLISLLFAASTAVGAIFTPGTGTGVGEVTTAQLNTASNAVVSLITATTNFNGILVSNTVHRIVADRTDATNATLSWGGPDVLSLYPSNVITISFTNNPPGGRRIVKHIILALTNSQTAAVLPFAGLNGDSIVLRSAPSTNELWFTSDGTNQWSSSGYISSDQPDFDPTATRSNLVYHTEFFSSSTTGFPSDWTGYASGGLATYDEAPFGNELTLGVIRTYTATSNNYAAWAFSSGSDNFASDASAGFLPPTNGLATFYWKNLISASNTATERIQGGFMLADGLVSTTIGAAARSANTIAVMVDYNKSTTNWVLVTGAAGTFVTNEIPIPQTQTTWRNWLMTVKTNEVKVYHKLPTATSWTSVLTNNASVPTARMRALFFQRKEWGPTAAVQDIKYDYFGFKYPYASR